MPALSIVVLLDTDFVFLIMKMENTNGILLGSENLKSKFI